MAERYPICRILVAIRDPYAKSFPAVTKAVQLAYALNARIELFHAIDLRLYSAPYDSHERTLGDDLESIRASYLRQLELIAAGSRRLGIVIAVAAEWDHPGYEAILRRAARDSSDLIVAQHPAEHQRASRRLHSTDWQLLRKSPIPILLVKRAEAYRRPLILAAVALRRTNTATQLDEHILGIGTTLARALQGRVHVVHTPTPAPPGPLTVATARRALAHLLNGSAIPQHRRHVVACGIAEMTRRLDSAIVVLGTESRTGLKGAFLGNTAEKALKLVDCDLLVVKPEHVIARVAARVRGADLIPGPSVPPVALPPLA